MSNFNMLLDLEMLQDVAEKTKESIKILNEKIIKKISDPENYLIQSEIGKTLQAVDNFWENTAGWIRFLDDINIYLELEDDKEAVEKNIKSNVYTFNWNISLPGDSLKIEIDKRLNRVVDILEQLSSLVKDKSAKNRIVNYIPVLRKLANSPDFNSVESMENGSLIDEKLTEKIEHIIHHKLGVFHTENYKTFFSEIMLKKEKETNKEINKKIVSINDELAQYKAEYELNVKDKLEKIRTELENTEKSNESLIKKIKAYDSLLSTATQHEVAKHYAKKARQEMATYYFFTTLSFVIIFGSIYFAWASLTNYYNSFIDPIGFKSITNSLKTIQIIELQTNAKYFLILRLVLSIILFSTIIYTARLAKNAYLHWRHSENMKLKLTSLSLFISNLDEDIQKQIHKDLVPDYFGKDAGDLDKNNEKFKDIPNNISALAIKAIEQTTALSSKNETNNQSTKN